MDQKYYRASFGIPLVVINIIFMLHGNRKHFDFELYNDANNVHFVIFGCVEIFMTVWYKNWLAIANHNKNKNIIMLIAKCGRSFACVANRIKIMICDLSMVIFDDDVVVALHIFGRTPTNHRVLLTERDIGRNRWSNSIDQFGPDN